MNTLQGKSALVTGASRGIGRATALALADAAFGSVAPFVLTITIIPFMPNGRAASAAGFPAMTGKVPFLMKDVVLLAVSFYLLKQDVVRAGRTNVPSLARNETALTIAARTCQRPVAELQK